MSKKRNHGEKQEPAICKKCEMKLQAMSIIQSQEKAGAIIWEVAGRAMQDAYHACPAVVFNTKFKNWCPKIESVFDISCNRDDIGDAAHPSWKCWAYYMGQQMMPNGIYDLTRYHEEMKNGGRKEDPESDPA